MGATSWSSSAAFSNCWMAGDDAGVCACAVASCITVNRIIAIIDRVVDVFMCASASSKLISLVSRKPRVLIQINPFARPLIRTFPQHLKDDRR